MSSFDFRETAVPRRMIRVWIFSSQQFFAASLRATSRLSRNRRGPTPKAQPSKKPAPTGRKALLLCWQQTERWRRGGVRTRRDSETLRVGAIYPTLSPEAGEKGGAPQNEEPPGNGGPPVQVVIPTEDSVVRSFSSGRCSRPSEEPALKRVATYCFRLLDHPRICES
jgi:hypothetical protein